APDEPSAYDPNAYVAPGDLTYDDFLAALTRKKGHPAAAAFSRAFLADPELKHAWSRLRSARDGAALRSALATLRDSERFSSLVDRFKDDIQFKALAHEIMRDPTIARLIREDKAAREGVRAAAGGSRAEHDPTRLGAIPEVGRTVELNAPRKRALASCGPDDPGCRRAVTVAAPPGSLPSGAAGRPAVYDAAEAPPAQQQAAGLSSPEPGYVQSPAYTPPPPPSYRPPPYVPPPSYTPPAYTPPPSPLPAPAPSSPPSVVAPVGPKNPPPPPPAPACSCNCKGLSARDCASCRARCMM
ncbi:MAG: hypothetical protein HY553_14900, partial [Elusimicrobia bacterium]|nr:hypothetical protein [Elusimicrobiota bacterium]